MRGKFMTDRPIWMYNDRNCGFVIWPPCFNEYAEPSVQDPCLLQFGFPG